MGSNCPSRQEAPRGPDPGELTVKVLKLHSCDVRLLCRMLLLNVRPEQLKGRLLRKARRPVVSKSMVRSSITRIDRICIVEMQLTGGPSATQTLRLGVPSVLWLHPASANASATAENGRDRVIGICFSLHPVMVPLETDQCRVARPTTDERSAPSPECPHASDQNANHDRLCDHRRQRRRGRSGVFAPASASFSTPMICSSVNLVLFISSVLLSGPDPNRDWRKIRGSRQQDPAALLASLKFTGSPSALQPAGQIAGRMLRMAMPAFGRMRRLVKSPPIA